MYVCVWYFTCGNCDIVNLISLNLLYDKAYFKKKLFYLLPMM